MIVSIQQPLDTAPQAARRPGFLGKPSFGDPTSVSSFPSQRSLGTPGSFQINATGMLHIWNAFTSHQSWYPETGPSPHASQDRRWHHAQQLPAWAYLPGLPARSQPYHPALPSTAQDRLESRAGTTPWEFQRLPCRRATGTSGFVKAGRICGEQQQTPGAQNRTQTARTARHCAEQRAQDLLVRNCDASALSGSQSTSRAGSSHARSHSLLHGRS